MSGSLVSDRREILSTLRRLAEQGEPVAAQWENEPPPASSTRLLAVNADHGEMVLDCFAAPETNRRVLRGDTVSLTTRLDGIELHFSTGRGESMDFDGQSALRLRLPEQMLRLQRREFFRVPASLPCDVVLEAGGKLRVLELRVSDLSLGGIGLVTDQAIDTGPGEVVGRCHLRLDGTHDFLAAIEVRSINPTQKQEGRQRLRLGCRFLSLAPDLERLLSRFVAKLERGKLR